MILGFTLTMPNIGSWNGKWSGEGNLYFRSKTLNKKDTIKLIQGKEERNFHYNWNDGWGANVNVRIITISEKNELEKKSKGFYGYDWMIDSIIEFGEILDNSDIKGRKLSNVL
jgi:hypothetical protein